MKNIKRILALVIVAMMLVAIAVIPASAAESIEPRRGPLCTNCGSSDISLFKTTYGSWEDTGTTRGCQHFTYGYDSYQKRKVTRRYECNDCSMTAIYSYSYEYRWYCKGHA